MPGSLDLFDGVDLTAHSESDPRRGGIDTLQIHHATTTSFSGLKALMDPGGRTVSANGAMANDGYMDEVVELNRRAYTSASSYDHRCLTVEVCNTTLGPQWGISDACRVRLARLAVAMFRAGILGSLTRAHIIGHYEVPGTYATACPGPDMNLDLIVALANQFYTEGETPPKKKVEKEMPIVVNNETGRSYAITPGFLKHHANAFERDLALKIAQQDTIVELSSFELQHALYNYGLEEFAFGASWDAINKGPGGKMWVASWLRERPVTT